MFFCRADLLDDRFEGSLTRANVTQREHLATSSAPDDPNLAARYRQMREWTAINCWSCNDYESAAMWSLYCPTGAGISVRTTFARLCDAFDKSAPWNVVIGKITYLDYDHAIVPERHHLAPFLHKRQSFEHEREVRAIVQRAPDPTMPNRISPFPRGGIGVRVALSQLIETVYVSPTAPAWYLELVRQIARRYSLPADVKQSSLAADPIY